MWRHLLSAAAMISAVSAQAAPGSPAYYQLQDYKNTHEGEAGVLTTSSGAPLSRADADNSLNDNLLLNTRFMEEATHFNRQRIPPRIVNAKGAGAFGEFVVTHDVTNVTNAALFSAVGKKTPLVARFSAVLSDRGTPDTIRNPYGFAVKFYTEEGNWDFTGFSTDTFTIKDPMFFASGCNAGFRNARTNLPDTNAYYDFLLSFPTSVSILTQFLGDMGIPYSFRHVPGYNIHTFQVENDKQERCYVRFMAMPLLGLKYLNSTVATQMAGARPYYYTEDLYNSIGRKDYPSWSFGMQVIPEKEVKAAGFDIFDITLRWPYDKFPVRPIGKLTLNRNSTNYFRDIEQAAFNPGSLVPGMQLLDKTAEARSMVYRDAAIARLGINYMNIPVNRPLKPALTYLRDGAAPVGPNGWDAPNYYPNVYNGPQPLNYTRTRTPRTKVFTDPRPTNLPQTTDYYLSLSSGAQRRLAQNIANTVAYAYPSIQQRAIASFGKVHPRLGADIVKYLKQAKVDVAEATQAPPAIED